MDKPKKIKLLDKYREADLTQQVERLKEQVDHLSQYAHCSMDYKDGYAHGGASVCQVCYNQLQADLTQQVEAWKETNKESISRILELEAEFDEVEKERNAFQTQAGVRKRENSRLKQLIYRCNEYGVCDLAVSHKANCPLKTILMNGG